MPQGTLTGACKARAFRRALAKPGHLEEHWDLSSAGVRKNFAGVVSRERSQVVSHHRKKVSHFLREAFRTSRGVVRKGLCKVGQTCSFFWPHRQNRPIAKLLIASQIARTVSGEGGAMGGVLPGRAPTTLAGRGPAALRQARLFQKKKKDEKDEHAQCGGVFWPLPRYAH